MNFTAILGLSGVGKTTLSTALARSTSGIAFNEPPREAWPEFISTGFIDNSFEVLHWFRCYQVDAIRNAKRLSKTSNTYTDAYYQKILADYIREESSNWIMPKTEVYFDDFYNTCIMDQVHLPLADKVIFIHAKYKTWVKLLESRDGPCDEIVLKEGFSTQKHMMSATRDLCAKYDIPLLEIEQKFGHFEDIHKYCLDWLEN